MDRISTLRSIDRTGHLGPDRPVSMNRISRSPWTGFCSSPTVQQFAARLPAMVSAATPILASRANAAFIAVQPHMDKIGLALGGLYGFFKQYLPEHDLGATEFPDDMSLPFAAGQAAGELAAEVPGLARAIGQGVTSERGIYNRAINFKPDATSVPLRAPSSGSTSLSEHRLEAR